VPSPTCNPAKQTQPPFHPPRSECADGCRDIYNRSSTTRWSHQARNGCANRHAGRAPLNAGCHIRAPCARRPEGPARQRNSAITDRRAPRHRPCPYQQAGRPKGWVLREFADRSEMAVLTRRFIEWGLQLGQKRPAIARAAGGEAARRMAQTANITDRIPLVTRIPAREPANTIALPPRAALNNRLHASTHCQRTLLQRRMAAASSRCRR